MATLSRNIVLNVRQRSAGGSHPPTHQFTAGTESWDAGSRLEKWGCDEGYSPEMQGEAPEILGGETSLQLNAENRGRDQRLRGSRVA
jgi:hypothetical protein